MLNKWQLFNEMVDYYRTTGRVLPEEAVAGLQEFDKFLDASRGPVSAPEMRQ